MTVQKGAPIMSAERAFTDLALRSSWGHDAQATINRLREQNLHTPAPGSSTIDYPGHVHRNNRDGRGILRLCDGGFYICDSATPGYLQHVYTGASSGSIAAGAASDYPEDPDIADSYHMGIAYVSPGVEAIKVEFQAWINSVAAAGIRIANLADPVSTIFSSYQLLTITPAWYSLAVAVVPAGEGKITRVPLDFDVLSISIVTVRLAAAFPFEYIDAPI